MCHQHNSKITIDITTDLLHAFTTDPQTLMIEVAKFLLKYSNRTAI